MKVEAVLAVYVLAPPVVEKAIGTLTVSFAVHGKPPTSKVHEPVTCVASSASSIQP